MKYPKSVKKYIRTQKALIRRQFFDTKKQEELKEFLDYAFSNNAKKVWCEFKTDFRKKVINALKDSNHKVNKINYTLVWPVFDMKQWNGDKMEGKDWKDIRYYWNKFFKEHKVEFVDLKDVTKEELKDLVKKWKESRNNKDKTFE